MPLRYEPDKPLQTPYRCWLSFREHACSPDIVYDRFAAVHVTEPVRAADLCELFTEYYPIPGYVQYWVEARLFGVGADYLDGRLFAAGPADWVFGDLRPYVPPLPLPVEGDDGT